MSVLIHFLSWLGSAWSIIVGTSHRTLVILTSYQIQHYHSRQTRLHYTSNNRVDSTVSLNLLPFQGSVHPRNIGVCIYCWDFPRRSRAIHLIEGGAIMKLLLFHAIYVYNSILYTIISHLIGRVDQSAGEYWTGVVFCGI